MKPNLRAKTPSGLSRLSPNRREEDVGSSKLSSRGGSAVPSPNLSPCLSPTSPLLSPPFAPLENGGRASPVTTGVAFDANTTPSVNRFKSRRQASVSILSTSVSARATSSRLSEAMKMRRASVSVYTPLKHMENINIDSGRSPNLKHVGEGALDDSDSSEGSAIMLQDALAFGRFDQSGSDLGDKNISGAALTAEGGSSTQARVTRPRTFSLSTVSTTDGDDVDNEDERDEMTVSPGSSETDSDDSVASTKPRRSSSTKRKSRSRSSTVVSQSAKPQTQQLNPLPRQESGSSIQTVTAGHSNEAAATAERSSATQHQPQVSNLSRGQRQESRSSGRDIERSVDRSSVSHTGTNRNKRRSQAFSVNSAVIVLPQFEEESDDSPADQSELRFLRWNGPAIRDTEAECRHIGWTTLQEMLEELADDVSHYVPIFCAELINVNAVTG